MRDILKAWFFTIRSKVATLSTNLHTIITGLPFVDGTKLESVGMNTPSNLPSSDGLI
jgi:hypothetical protein